MNSWKNWKQVQKKGEKQKEREKEKEEKSRKNGCPDSVGWVELEALFLISQYSSIFLLIFFLKIFTGEDPYASLPFFRHGSADSLDEDRLYLFPEMPDDKTCRQFISGVSDDRNIFVITDGYVSDCYKGTKFHRKRLSFTLGYPDEIQNALQETYPLHKQEFQLPLSVRAQRVVTLKIICALTGM